GSAFVKHILCLSSVIVLVLDTEEQHQPEDGEHSNDGNGNEEHKFGHVPSVGRVRCGEDRDHG
ncbi:hypothetical protein ADUPG1_005183, partial [Aduncisulcus paluster]